MNHIRLVWSCIWNVLSEFFVSVGLSENLSVAIFVMDSLRQLVMKFLEREELANYNFQNEFLKPFVVIMQKSNSSEICELIVRCVSQMVLSCVNHVKSGWKSVFMVFTTAVADDRSLHCLLTIYTWKKCTLRKKREELQKLEKEKQAELRSYKSLMVYEKMTFNKKIASANKSLQELEDDFM
ncbi:hypothetical protein ZIOFF_026458 [Zingiber officinale]|uniref:Mon2/Sec7/BIG1-like HDS domain-containing protein n=1 Tax=Zingiber officinale TaxID=94328 RepID=A0A8J5H487_ZINOF|nr:hypothetical protein ZIOFF_026458 [Zingiber officinale]